MRKPPPPESSRLRLTVKDLAVSIPTVVALLLVAGLIGLPLSLSYHSGAESVRPLEGPAPLPGPQVPLQTWAAGAAPGQLLSAVAPGTLPSPLQNQKTSKCDADLGEQMLRGGCWMPTDKKPPCPAGKLWEYKDRCWRPIPRTALPPTTGEPPNMPVAGDEQ